MWELTTVALIAMVASGVAIWLLGRREARAPGEGQATGYIILLFAVVFLVGLVMLVGDMIYRIYTG